MSFVKRYTVSVTTAADGSATAYVGPVRGRVAMVSYTKVDFAAGVDFTITTEDTGQNVWVDADVNASQTVYPVAAGNLGGTGAASTITEAPIYAADERVKIVLAQGGNAKTGTFTVVIA